MSSNDENKIRKTLLTPCRRVGLKRKSLERTPNTSIISSNSPSPYSCNTVVNKSLPKSEAIDMTPTRQDTEKSVRVQVPKKLKIYSPASNSATVDEQSEIPSTFSSEVNDQKEDDVDLLIRTINERISVKKKEIDELESNSKNVKQVISLKFSLFNNFRVRNVLLIVIAQFGNS